MSADFLIDNLRVTDLPSVLSIQSESYPGYLVESRQVFLSRLSLKNSCCLAAREGELLLGYMIAHGWQADDPPPLGIVVEMAEQSDVLFIHDLAVSNSGRCRGIGKKLVEHAFDCARSKGMTVAQLVAVEGATRYWRGLGFTEAQTAGNLRAKVREYGADARWMSRLIPAGSTNS